MNVPAEKPDRTLFDALCDETLTPEQASELESQLRQSEVLRKDLLRYVRLHLELHENFRGLEAEKRAFANLGICVEPTPPTATPESVPSVTPAEDQDVGSDGLGQKVRQRHPRPSLWILVASVLVALGLGYAWFREGFQTVATITEAEEVVWKSKPLNSGQRIGTQEIRIESGRLGVTLASAAEMLIDGKVELDVLDGQAVRMHQGWAAFHCPETAHGFTVTLPGGTQVVDLGTNFEVDVAPDGTTRVLVSQGRVEVRAPGERAVALEAGQQVAVQQSGERPIGAVSPIVRSERWQQRLLRTAQSPSAWLVLPLDGNGNPLRPATQVEVHGVPQPCADRFGNAGQALHFNGIDTWLYYPLTWPTGNCTLSVWFRSEHHWNPEYLIAAEPVQRDGVLASRRLRVFRQLVKGDAFVSGYPGQGQFGPLNHIARGGSGQIQLKRWTHVLITFQHLADHQVEMLVYVDGKQTSSNRYEYRKETDVIAPGLTVGNSPHQQDDHCFFGDLDEVVLLQRAISAEEVQQWYEASRPEGHAPVDFRK